jgi:hypothetical protein
MRFALPSMLLGTELWTQRMPVMRNAFIVTNIE